MLKKTKSKYNKFFNLVCASSILLLSIFQLKYSEQYIESIIYKGNITDLSQKKYINDNSIILINTIKDKNSINQIEKLKISLNNTHNTNYFALLLLNFNNAALNIVYTLHQDTQRTVIQNEYKQIYQKILQGKEDIYLKYSDKTALIALSYDSKTVELFANNLFDGDYNLSRDFVYFHEMAHFLYDNMIENINNKNDLIYRKDTVLNDILTKIYSESFADTFALFFLAKKYSNLNIDYVANNLALFRTNVKGFSVSHFTSWAVLKFKNTKDKDKIITLEEISSLADEYAKDNINKILQENINDLINNIKFIIQLNKQEQASSLYYDISTSKKITYK